MTALGGRLTAGVRRAWLPLTLAACCFVLSWPAFRDLERLLIGLGVISALLAAAIIGFTASSEADRN